MAERSTKKADPSGPFSCDSVTKGHAKKADTLTIRLTPEQRLMLDAEVVKTGRSLSDLAREALFVGLTAGFKPSAAPRLAPVRRRAYVPEDPALIAAVGIVGVQAELIGQTLEQCRTTGDLVDLAKVLLLLRSIEHAASRAMPPLWRRWEEDYQRGPPDGKKAAKTAATPAPGLFGQASVSGKAFEGDSAQEDRRC